MPSMSQDVLELRVGDLVTWHGKQTEHSGLNRRVIYQVIERTQEGAVGGQPHYRHKLRVAFDFERPTGVDLATTTWSTYELRKLSLLDLGTLRLHFDTFIRWWAETQGFEDQYERPEDGKYGQVVAAPGADPDQGTPPT